MNKWIISCEHGGNQIPSFLKEKLKIPPSLLNSHRGYDYGALKIANDLSQKLSIPQFIHKETRLAIDYNRSLHHPSLWSSYSKKLDEKGQSKLIESYQEYRKNIEKECFGKGSIFHFSIHSFTPQLNGVVRHCDIGLLYDPSRKKEKEMAYLLKRELVKKGFHVRMNYPYAGKADGLTSYLRKKIGTKYSGFEIEFNQKLLKSNKSVSLKFIDCFKALMNQYS